MFILLNKLKMRNIQRYLIYNFLGYLIFKIFQGRITKMNASFHVIILKTFIVNFFKINDVK